MYRERGKAVHLACALWDTGELDEGETDAGILGYLVGYRNWCSDSGFTPRESERIVFSGSYSYAGTLDRVGVVGGMPTLVDLKTGDPPRCTALQLAAYDLAYEEETGIRCGKRIGLRLFSDGKYRVREWSGLEDRVTWLSALRLWRWKEKEL
jgi:hypothetical protein